MKSLPCGVFLLVFEEPLEESLVRKVFEVARTLRSAGRRTENRYEIGIEGAKRFGLASPVVELSDGMQNAKCIISNASLLGVLLTGDRSHISIGSPVCLKCKFADEKHVVLQKSVAVSIGRASSSSSHFFYSLHFVEPVSFIWQKHIASVSDL